MNEVSALDAWEHDAVAFAIAAGVEIVAVAHCMNTPPRVVSRKNLAYYALARASRIKLASTTRRDLNDLIPSSAPRIHFRAETEGAWQRIPSATVAEFPQADVMLKFGMKLLRGADALPFRHGVLSYHHGDPTRYRGRPASFYELLQGQDVQGAMVQRISDVLDGGTVVAQAWIPVVPHSYGRTLARVHQAGVPLLGVAVRRLEAGQVPEQPSEWGPNYRLPNTRQVARFCMRMLRARGRRLAYGALVEKHWRSAWAAQTSPIGQSMNFRSDSTRPIPTPRGFTFVADPHLGADDRVYAEVMNARTGLGELMVYDDGEWTSIDLGLRGHASYPQVVLSNDGQFLFPEVASVRSPVLFRLGSDGVRVDECIEMKGLESERLVDATLWRNEETWFLFAGRAGRENWQLDLWTAPEVRGPYSPHPASPVSTDARSARMAGPLVRDQGRLFRCGQDCSQRYGGRVTVSEVKRLSPTEYEDVPVSVWRFEDAWGPHTVSLRDGEVLMDYYIERRHPLAGWRRFRAALHRARQARAHEAGAGTP